MLEGHHRQVQNFGKRRLGPILWTSWHYVALKARGYSVAKKDEPSHIFLKFQKLKQFEAPSFLLSPGIVHLTSTYINFLKTKSLLYMKKFCPHSRPAQKTAAKCTLMPEFEVESQRSQLDLSWLKRCMSQPRILVFDIPRAAGRKTGPAGSKSEPS